MRRLLRALLVAAGVLAIQPVQAAGEAPAILLAGKYHPAVAVDSYLISEKLDGVRAIWDGHTLRFRSGRTVPAPAWFVAALPVQALDGELWLGRGRFETLSGLVRQDPPDDAAWRQVRYMIFELPGAAGDFRQRAAAIQALVATVNLPFLQAVEQFQVVDRAALERRFKQVVAGGGEGLMLHRADSLYETGRSDTLLKMKPQDDAEGVVVAHLPGKGKYAGQTGALRLRLPDGREIRLGSGLSDTLRQAPPPIGSTVTYRYRDLTAKGLPRFASFLRVREE